MSAEATKRLLEAYESKRKERPSVEKKDDVQESSYRKAAAVLHCFVPETLNPLDPTLVHPRPRVLLFDEVASVIGGRPDGLFALKPEKRRQTLKEFSTREAMAQALKANPARPMTSLQKLWEGYLQTGAVPKPDSLGYSQLTDLCQIVSWMDGKDASLPDVNYLLGLVRRKSVLASFEHLVISDFTGREVELAMLRQHCGITPNGGTLHAIANYIKSWLKGTTKPIIAIHGSGGIGKSALIGRLLWEQALAPAEQRIPFAYLAFDQPTLRIDNPFTILVDAASQLEHQYPEKEKAFKSFYTQVRVYRDARDALGKRKESVSRNARLSTVHSLDTFIYREFGKLLKKIGKRKIGTSTIQLPILLALDTFEEVQYRDAERLAGFWNMLDQIYLEYRPLRVIISGRALVGGPGMKSENVETKELLELPLPDRVSLLERLGVSDPEIANGVAHQVGGNPLALRLAANVIVADPTQATSKGIKDLTNRKWLFFKVDEQIIQGQLYRRILQHIHDENVRKLAHPGMVLRRVTPDVILKVLAPLCEISVSDLAEAERLFEALKQEHGLVEGSGKGVLVYRPEIRLAMIRLLEQDKFEEVRELHQAAIYYYENQEGTAARAEEIYHRLVLDKDDPWILDSRWIQGIESSVAASLDEYPDRAKAWLASRINLEVPRSVFQNADISEWERNITRKVQRALSDLEIDWALSLLRERSDRSEASPLFALEAKAHLLRNEFTSAEEVVAKGIERVSDSTNRGRLAELFWLQAQIKLLMGENAKAADEALSRAEQSVEKSSNPIALMHVLCQRLLLRERYPNEEYAETTAQLRLKLSSVCERASEENAFSAEFVVALAIQLLANEFPKTTDRLRSLVPYDYSDSVSDDSLTSENLQGLDGYRERWELMDESPSESAA